MMMMMMIMSSQIILFYFFFNDTIRLTNQLPHAAIDVINI